MTHAARRTWPRLRATARWCALGVALSVGLSCRGNPEVTFDLEVPQSVAGQTAWFEIGGFSEGYCQAIKPVMAAGMPLDGTIFRMAFRKGNATPPPVGDLKKGVYAFAAVARGEDCGVVASGCVEVDLSVEREIRVPLDALATRTGACGAEAQCSAARCVPSRDSTKLGAGCSLALLGAGPLGNALAATGESVSGPAIAATAEGFLVAYREVDNEGNARLTLLPLDAGGGALAPLVSPRLNGGLVRDYCAESAPSQTDSAALLLGPAGGTVVLSHPPCGSIGGVDVFTTDPSGIINAFGRYGSLGVTTSLSQGHALFQNGPTPVLAYVQNGQAGVAAVVGVDLDASERHGKFGGGTATGAWIAGDKSLSFLSLGAGGTTPPPPPPADAGADASSDAGRDTGAAPTPKGEGVLRLKSIDATNDLTKFTSAPAVTVTEGVGWASLAVVGKRTLVIAPSTSEGSPVDLYAYDGAERVGDASIAVEGIGDATSGDIAISGDRALIAVLRRGEVSLVAYDRVTTSPVPFEPPHAVSFLRDSRIPSIAKVDGGKVAVTTSGNRVAVAWSTAGRLDINKPVGGYAIFACAP